MDEAPLTIAICTKDREKFLRMCLDGLLKSPGIEKCKILVVNNASSDNTSELLSGYREKISILHESKIGLSNARNTALEHCKTRYLVFLDDDGVVSLDWVAAISDIIENGSPDVFGGPYTPFYLSTKEPWFLDDFGSAHTELSDGLQPVGTCFSGGNMGWKADLIREMGGFDPNLGISGGQLKLGEETALQIAIWRLNPDAKFVFSHRMHMQHYVAPQKMAIRYIHKRNFIFGWQLLEIENHGNLLDLSSWKLVKMTKFGLPLILRIFIRDRVKFPYWKTYVASYLSLQSIVVGILSRRFCGGIKRIEKIFVSG